LRLQYGYIDSHQGVYTSRPTPVFALLAIVLMARCTAAPQSTTDNANPTVTSRTSSTPGITVSPDEPPRDFDGVDATLDSNEPPHIV
jgi:hypothetical protein